MTWLLVIGKYFLNQNDTALYMARLESSLSSISSICLSVQTKKTPSLSICYRPVTSDCLNGPALLIFDLGTYGICSLRELGETWTPLHPTWPERPSPQRTAHIQPPRLSYRQSARCRPTNRKTIKISSHRQLLPNFSFFFSSSSVWVNLHRHVYFNLNGGSANAAC